MSGLILSYETPRSTRATTTAVVLLWLWAVLDGGVGLLMVLIALSTVRETEVVSTFVMIMGMALMGWAMMTAIMATGVSRRDVFGVENALRALRVAEVVWMIGYGIGVILLMMGLVFVGSGIFLVGLVLLAPYLVVHWAMTVTGRILRAAELERHAG